MSGQVLDAAEVLRTLGTLKPLARGRRGGLWLCRFFRGPARGSFCKVTTTAFPGGRSLHSVHGALESPCEWAQRGGTIAWRWNEERPGGPSLGEEGGCMGFGDDH
jgi:hypothetical protein